MAKPTVLDVIDQAYAASGEAATAWLDALAESARGALGEGLGALAYTVTGAGRRFALGVPVARGTSGLTMAAFVMANRLSPRRALERAYHQASPCLTLSEHVGAEKLARDPVARTYGKLSGVADFLVVKALQPTGNGVAVGVPLPRARALEPAFRETWSLAAAHVAAAQRLNASRRVRSDGLPSSTQAVIRPGGGVVHAEAAARTCVALLADVAARIDRARLSPDPARALDAWPALVEGRWSITEHFEHDGSRFFVARHNVPGAPPGRRLSMRERQVVALRALGHSQKLVAYELGISVSSVAALERRALKKLNLESSLSLVSLGAALLRGDD